MASKFGPSDWMKNAIPLAYTRVSTNDQDPKSAGTKTVKKKPILKKQFTFINDQLKTAGLKQVTPSNWYAEVASGTKFNRGQWNAIQQRAISLANEGNKVYIVIKDPSRWSRNSRHSMVAIHELHNYGIPVYAAREGIQTGSEGDLHPTEELLFLQLQGGAAYLSQVQKEKAHESVDTSKKEGTVSAKGLSLFPFADVDPLDAYLDNVNILIATPIVAGKTGPNAFAMVVSALGGVNGPSKNSVKTTFRTAETLRRKNLTTTEYNKWRRYRTKIRNILIKRNSDPYAKGTDAGKYDFGSQALMMMVGRSLAEPHIYRERTDKEIAEYLKNPKDYLSVKDRKIWRNIVGKR